MTKQAELNKRRRKYPDEVLHRRVRRAEKLASKLFKQLQDSDEANLQKVAHILKRYDLGEPPVVSWRVIEPDGLESLTWITHDGLYCQVQVVLHFEDWRPDEDVPHYRLWRDMRFDTVSWVTMFDRTVDQMKRALELLSDPR